MMTSTNEIEVNSGLFVVLSFIGVLIIVSNIFVIIVIARNECLRDVTGCFMASMSVADLGVGASMLLPIVHIAFSMYLHPHTCDAMGFINSVAWVVSVFSLSLLSLDRCVQIGYPFQYLKLTYQRTLTIAIPAVWIISILIWSFPLAGYGSFKFNDEEVTCYFDVGSHSLQWIVYMVIIFAPSSVVIIASYTKIWLVTLRHRRQIHAETAESNVDATASGKKAHWTISMIVGAFYFAWTPFVVEHIVKAVQGSLENIPEWLEIAIYLLAASNSFWNPLIYVSTNKRFRHKSVQLLISIFPCRCFKQAQLDNDDATNARDTKSIGIPVGQAVNVGHT